MEYYILFYRRQSINIYIRFRITHNLIFRVREEKSVDADFL